MKSMNASALALILSLSAIAAQASDDNGAARPASAHPAEASAPVAADGLTAMRDPVTGKLRAPTADELAAIHSPAARPLAASRNVTRKASVQAAAPAVRSFASGAHNAKLPEHLASFVVVKRQPDGSLDSKCVQGTQAAADELAATPAHGSTPTEPPAQ
jgi:hypothetical protein